MPPRSSHANVPTRAPSDEARRVAVLAAGAVRVIKAARLLRRDRDAGRLTETAYDEAIADLLPLPGRDDRPALPPY